jgi:energy-coupling factor transporter ATP-binding protein EcfA2
VTNGELRLCAIDFVNYRSFGDKPSRLRLDRDSVAILGVNNSGKSTLLRAFYELRPVFAWLSNELPGCVAGALNAAPGQNNFGESVRLAAGERLTPIDREVETRVSLLFAADEETDPSIRFTLCIGPQTLMVRRLELVTSRGKLAAGTAEWWNPNGEQMVQGRSASGSEIRLHIGPVMNAFRDLSRAMYVGAFRNVLNEGGGEHYDIRIGSSFVQRFAEFASGNVAANNEAVHDLSVELATVFGYERLEVRPTPDSTRLTVVANGRSFRLTEMGAGLSQFIVAAANVLVSRPSWLMIDEPESNLHARLQTDFLSLVAGRTERGVIYATHSLGLAHAAEEIMVTTRDETGRSALVGYNAVPSLSSALGALNHGGVNEPNYHGVLLVEGVTDVRVFQQFLRLLDHQGSIGVLSLGGDGLVKGGRGQELEDIARLSPRIFAVVDSERTNASDRPIQNRLDFAADCEQAKIDCHILERRAIENYFTESAIQAELGGSYGALNRFEKPAGWAKERNWRIAARMSRDDLHDTDLLGALEKVLEGR